MSTNREFQSHPAPSAPIARGRLRVRIAGAFLAMWKRVASRVPMRRNAEIHVACVPPITKIPAISIAGMHTRPVRKGLSRMVASVNTKPARRPGVQGRWKTSDRVATL